MVARPCLRTSTMAPGQSCGLALILLVAAPVAPCYQAVPKALCQRSATRSLCPSGVFTRLYNGFARQYRHYSDQVHML